MTQTMTVTTMERQHVDVPHDLGILNVTMNEFFNEITQLAMDFFQTSGAFITLMENKRLSVKSSMGIYQEEFHENCYCNRTVQNGRLTIIEDVSGDPDGPIAGGPSNIRFYAGAPLLTTDGSVVGTLCIVDTKVQKIGKEKLCKLMALAKLLMTHLKLRHTAGLVDVISGLPNTYQLEEDMVAQARTSDGERRVLTYLDIPSSATALEIKSALGMHVYDDLIRAISVKIRSDFLGRARVYHVNESRFAILSSDAEVEAFMEFMAAKVESFRLHECRLQIPLNLSSIGGSVVFSLCPSSYQDAQRKAASAINQASITLQNWCSYDVAEDVIHQRSFRLLNDFPGSIKNDEFHLVYQPKHSLLTGNCVSVEALLRWTHPELGVIAPAEFVPLIEKTSLIKIMTDWVIRAAIKQVAHWRHTGYRIKVAINLSSHNFQEPDIYDRLLGTCREFDLPPDYLEIECTEGVWMESADIMQTLRHIRSSGISLALDDFGTGYSNFSYLQKVPANVVKIDQSLIRNIDSNLRDQQIVRSVIALSKELGYEVIGEGVETEASLKLIRDYGCHFAQGYHFSRPLSAADCIEYIKGGGSVCALPIPT